MAMPVGGSVAAPVGGGSVALLDDGDKEPTLIDVSEELKLAILRAATLPPGDGGFELTFTSLFIGLVAGEDRVGIWLRQQLVRQNRLLNLLERKSMDRAAMGKLGETRPPDPSAPIRRSVSAKSALDEAQRWVRDRGGGQIDTRHVVAAYISLPTYHDDDFREIGIDRVEWAQQFGALMADSHPSEGWDTFASRVFPGSSGVQQQRQKRPSQQVPVNEEEAHAKAAREIAAETARAADLDAPDSVESSVRDALREATGLAGTGRIQPSHVLRAIVNVAPTAGSPAFARLAELLPLAAAKPQKPVPAFEQQRLHDLLRRQIVRAREPLPGSTEPTTLWGRDLVAAALLAGDEAEALVASASTSLGELRDAWFGYVTSENQHRSLEQWHSWWRFAGFSLPAEPLTGMALESSRGVDHLGIEDEARAFARLILDRNVEAPLSIGLLGDWGSGKSFFIGKIRDQIKELTEARPPPPELYHHPIEIEFNAWQASDANLWASLVTHIFDGIWEQAAHGPGLTREEREQKIEEVRAKLLKEIEGARGAVHEAEGQVEQGRKAVEAAERELKEKRSELDLGEALNAAAKEKLVDLGRQVGWDKALETITDVEKATGELKTSQNRLRATVQAFFESPGTTIFWPTVGMVVLVGLLWLLMETQTEAIARIGRWTSALTGGLAALVVPIKVARGKLDKFTAQLEDARKKYFAPKDAKEKAAIEQKRKELKAAEERVASAREQLAKLTSDYAALDPRRRLGAFLEERVQSTVYRSQQGIISLVHKDFRELSSYMRNIRKLRAEPNPPPEATDTPIYFDRIILYVDDLDRCRPDHVVHMLEAIHLLLALDLFIVVLAVDSRWLVRALEVHYKELLTAQDERASTPQNYLEKIFQITYALGPMDPAHFKKYVKALAGADKEAAKPTVNATAAEKQPETATTAKEPQTKGSAEAKKDGAQGATASTTATATATKPDTAVAQPESAAKKPAPPIVKITDEEQAIIESLVPLLPTPRIAKRLVNVYRLIRSAQEAGEREKFDTDDRAHSCLLVLAILFGRPAVASALLRGLYEGSAPFDQGGRTLLEAVKTRKKVDGEPAHVTAEWARLAATLTAMKSKVTVEQCAREPRAVARYSLVTGHDWHTWKR